MKICILSAIPAVPPVGGNRSRIYSLSKTLRDIGHEIYFVHIPSKFIDGIDREAHAREFGVDHFISLSDDHIKSASYNLQRFPYRVRRKLLSKTNLDLSYYYGLDESYPRSVSTDIARIHNKISFDAVICEYVFYSKSLEIFPSNVIKLIDAHDSFADRHKLYKSRDSYWYSMSRSEQVKGFRRADIVIAIQDSEADLFRDQIKGDSPRVEVVSHIMVIGDPVSDFPTGKALFVGSANRANIDAIGYLAKDILPRIQAVVPDFQLFVAGGVCGAFADRHGIVKLGIVDDLREVYRIAPLAINPMLTGTGINIKLLEAMAHGVPTVSTATGVRGLGKPYSNGVVAVEDDDPEAFADAVVRFTRDSSRMKVAGGAAFADAQAWNQAQISMLRLILAS